jgi:hypothetical protein
LPHIRANGRVREVFITVARNHGIEKWSKEHRALGDVVSDIYAKVLKGGVIGLAGVDPRGMWLEASVFRKYIRQANAYS